VPPLTHSKACASFSLSDKLEWYFMKVDDWKRKLADKDESTAEKQNVKIILGVEFEWNVNGLQKTQLTTGMLTWWLCDKSRGAARGTQRRWTYWAKCLSQIGWRCLRGSDVSKKASYSRNAQKYSTHGKHKDEVLEADPNWGRKMSLPRLRKAVLLYQIM
jgi:hypothetical protein